jgi:DNA-directed RNA polymerase specialized sigma24 family protein
LSIDTVEALRYNVRAVKRSGITSLESSRVNAASEEEVVAALNVLTDAQLKALKQYARWRIRGLGRKSLGRDHEDLLQEAVTATLAGDRRWNNESVDFFGHLLGVMRSISWNWGRLSDEDTPYLESEVVRTTPEGQESNPMLDVASLSQDGRRITAAKAHVEHIEKLVSDRPLASLIVDGMREEMTGPEIKEALGISQRELETEMRWLRRTARADRDQGGN